MSATGESPALAKTAPTVAHVAAGGHGHRGAPTSPFDWEGRWGTITADHD